MAKLLAPASRWSMRLAPTSRQPNPTCPFAVFTMGQAVQFQVRTSPAHPSAECKMVRKSELNNSAILNSHTNPSRISQKLPNRLNAKRCASQVLWEYYQVLLNASEVAEQNTTIFHRVWSCLWNDIKSSLWMSKISEQLRPRHSSAWQVRCTSSRNLREWKYSMFLSNSTIRYTIPHLHTWIWHSNWTDIQSGRYLNWHDNLQVIHYRCPRLELSPTRSVLVQLMLPRVQYAYYSFVWQPRWSCQHNQPNHEDLCTLLESPAHILELVVIIPIVEYFCTS